MIAVLCLVAVTGWASELPPEVMQSPFGIVNPWPEVGASGMGAVWCRCGGGSTQLGDWPKTAPASGVLDWQRAEDEWEAYYVKESLVPTPILSYTPQWASKCPAGENPRSRPPDDLWDYYRFCREISARFAGRIHFWEVWNEPNIGFFDGTVAQYVDLLKTAAVAVREGAPEAWIVFGGVAGVDIPFLDRAYQFGARDYFDVMAAHPYQWGSTFDDRWFCEKLTNLKSLMDTWDDLGKPVWLNELGWSTADKRVSDADQARLLVQCYVTAMARRDLAVQRIFWFCVKDWGGPSYGVYAENGAKKPSWHAYRAMVQQLSGLRCWGRVKTTDEVRAYAYIDDARHRCVVVVWSADLDDHELLPASLQSPVSAHDINGEMIERPGLGDEGLMVAATPAPTYLEFRPQDIASLVQPIAPVAIELPDPRRRAAAWLSVYPQPGCSLPWLWRGESTALRGRLFNAGDEPIGGEVVVRVGDEGVAVSAPVTAQPDGDATFSIMVPCPAEEGPEAWMIVRFASEDARIPDIRIKALVSDGPTLNFLANSYLERAWYLQPEAKSGCAESVRFGAQWTYRMPCPVAGAADVRLNVGAHASQPWEVSWSQDGKSWAPLMRGASPRSWHAETIEKLKIGSLWLRCKGDNQQVGEVIVAYRKAP